MAEAMIGKGDLVERALRGLLEATLSSDAKHAVAAELGGSGEAEVQDVFVDVVVGP